MTDFVTSYGFTQVTSSPHCPRSNRIYRKNCQNSQGHAGEKQRPTLGSTQLWYGLSPAQLLMGRRIRNTLSQILHNLIIKWPYLEMFEEQDRQYKRKQRRNYDKRHRVWSLADIPDEQPVWVNTDGQQQQGRTVTTTEAPRSHLIDVPSGRVRNKLIF